LPAGVREAAERRNPPPAPVRQVFLDFATDLAAAEDRKDLVKVLAAVDGYVDEVLKSLAKA
jgi:hypothetical protein